MYKRILTVAILMLPTMAFAQQQLTGTEVEGGIGDTIQQFYNIVQFALGIALPVAIGFFFFGLIKFISKGEDAKLKEGGKKMMLSSGIALFLMVGIWTVLGYVQSSLRIENQGVEVSGAPTLDVIPQ